MKPRQDINVFIQVEEDENNKRKEGTRARIQLNLPTTCPKCNQKHTKRLFIGNGAEEDYYLGSKELGKVVEIEMMGWLKTESGKVIRFHQK